MEHQHQLDDEDLEPTEFAEVLHVNLDAEEQMDPDDEVVIQWDRDHDWRVLVEEYNEGRDFSDDSAQYEAVRKYFVRPVEAAAAAAAVDNGVELNELQKLAIEMIRALIASPNAYTGEKLDLSLLGSCSVAWYGTDAGKTCYLSKQCLL